MVSMGRTLVLFLVCTLLVLSWHVGYAFHFFEYAPLWDVIHSTYHIAGWFGFAFIAVSLLYIVRKKKWITAGKMKFWLNLHIYLGLAGSFLISFHSYGKLYGVALIAYLCMWIVSLTGFFGVFLQKRLKEQLKDEIEKHKEFGELLKSRSDSNDEASVELQQKRIELDEKILALIEEGGKLKAPSPKADVKEMKGIFGNLLQEKRRLKDAKKEIDTLFMQEVEGIRKRYEHLSRGLELESSARSIMATLKLFNFWKMVHIPFTIWMIAALLVHLFSFIYY